MKPWTCVRVVLSALVLAGLVGLCGCEDDSGNPAAGHDFGTNDPNVYAAMGDSITTYGWPAILAGQLGATVYNSSQGGAPSSTGASSVNGVLSRYKPGYLLILYGANDVIREYGRSSTMGNLRRMIQAAKANQTIPVIGTLTPMRDGHKLWAGSARALNEMIRQMAGEEGVAVADLERAFGDRADLLQPDGLHPTAAGSEVIASTFHGAVR